MLKNKAKCLARRQVFEGYCFDVVVDDVHWPNQKKLSRDLIVHGGISVMVPELDRNHLVLLRQYRYGAGQVLWEIPAGTMAPGETALACAKREMEEEIGYRAKTWEKLTACYASPGFSTEVIHCFAARGLTRTQTNLEDDEILQPRVVSLREVREMIRTRKIRDAKTLVALFYYLAKRGSRP